MDQLTITDEIETKIEQTMRELGVSYRDAAVIVVSQYGTATGAGDVLCVHPLTEEQKRQLGLNTTINDLPAEDS